MPPFATGSVPVTPVVSGSPVRLVATPEAGVPRAGVTKVGEVAKTSAPLPVSSVIAAARFAEDGVPSHVATPAPKEPTPVPPLATGSVPVTPVVSGKPVAFVSTPEEGVPSAGVTRVGEVAKTSAPEPVSSESWPEMPAEVVIAVKAPAPLPTRIPVRVVTPVPPLATGRVPVTPVVSGKPVAFVSTKAVGVPSAGVVSVGEVPKTATPVPVSSVIAAARFAEEGVPSQVATPAPKLVTPVPPLATESVPEVITPAALDCSAPTPYALKVTTPTASIFTRCTPAVENPRLSAATL